MDTPVVTITPDQAPVSITPDVASGPITTKPQSDAEWSQLKSEHGLPENYDLSKNLVENYGNLSDKEINSIDLNKLQHAYAIANPQEARGPGFFRNMFGEAADIIKGTFAKPAATAGVAGSPGVGEKIEAVQDNPVNAIPIVGPMAVQRSRQLISGDIAGATGAGITDLAALLAPLALHKTIEAIPEDASADTLKESLGKKLYDPKTGAVIDIKKAATDALVRKFIPNPYEEQAAYEQKAQDLMRRGREQAILDRQQAVADRQAARNAPKPLPLNPFAGMTSTTPAEVQTMPVRSLENTPAGSASGLPLASDLPKGSPTPFPAKFVSKFEEPPAPDEPYSQDLITRNQRLVRPNEMPTEADLKRAGDYTQIPALRLRALKKFGDRLAANELTRRGIND